MTETTLPEIQQRIRGVLGDRLGEAATTLAPDSDIAEALGDRYDSLTAMECVTAVETEFDIEVDFVTHDVRHWFATIERMALFVRGELEDRALLGAGG